MSGRQGIVNGDGQTLDAQTKSIISLMKPSGLHPAARTDAINDAARQQRSNRKTQYQKVGYQINSLIGRLFAECFLLPKNQKKKQTTEWMKSKATF